jgi:protein-disulfide isomerase
MIVSVGAILDPMKTASRLTLLRKVGVGATALAVLLALTACEQRPRPAPPSQQDIALGAPGAPVTVIEYASVACPHCAAFNDDVFPRVRAAFVDTGKVRWILREALTGDTAVAAAGFLTAHCAGPAKYFDAVDKIFHAQGLMYASGQPERVLLGIARQEGVSDARFEACIGDQAALAAMSARWRDDMQNQGIRTTPTFVIGDKVYEGAMSFDQLSVALDRARGRRL